MTSMVSKQLGHANPTINLSVYSHLLKTENQEAALRLENTIGEILVKVKIEEKGSTGDQLTLEFTGGSWKN